MFEKGFENPCSKWLFSIIDTLPNLHNGQTQVKILLTIQSMVRMLCCCYVSKIHWLMLPRKTLGKLFANQINCWCFQGQPNFRMHPNVNVLYRWPLNIRKVHGPSLRVISTEKESTWKWFPTFYNDPLILSIKVESTVFSISDLTLHSLGLKLGGTITDTVATLHRSLSLKKLPLQCRSHHVPVAVTDLIRRIVACCALLQLHVARQLLATPELS